MGIKPAIQAVILEPIDKDPFIHGFNINDGVRQTETDKNGHKWKVITLTKKHGVFSRITLAVGALFATLGTLFIGLFVNEEVKNLWRKAITGKEIVVFKIQKPLENKEEKPVVDKEKPLINKVADKFLQKIGKKDKKDVKKPEDFDITKIEERQKERQKKLLNLEESQKKRQKEVLKLEESQKKLEESRKKSDIKYEEARKTSERVILHSSLINLCRHLGLNEFSWTENTETPDFAIKKLFDTEEEANQIKKALSEEVKVNNDTFYVAKSNKVDGKFRVWANQKLAQPAMETYFQNPRKPAPIPALNDL